MDDRPRAQGDVQGVRGGVRRPGPVRNAWAAPRGGLAAGAGSAAAPGAGGESCNTRAILIGLQ